MAEGRIIDCIKDILAVEACLALSSIAAAPLKRVKLLMQNEEVLIKAGRLLEPYQGIRDCFGRTVKDEGFLSLWRGNSASLLRFFPHQVQYSIFKRRFKKMFYLEHEEDSYWKRYMKNLVSVCASDLYGLVLVYSLDCARTKLATDVKAAKKGGERQFKGLIDVYRKTLKSDGFTGLYRGFGISCAYVVVVRALLSGLNDFLKPMLPAVPLLALLLGWGTNIVASLGAYPIDTIRRRVMLSSGKRISTIAMFTQITAKQGVKSLYKGAYADVFSFVLTVAVHRLYSMIFLL